MRGIWRNLAFFILIVGGLVIVRDTKPIYAQDNSCASIIDDLRPALARCSQINSGWACYGNITALAAPEGVRFTRLSDRQPVTALDTIQTTPLAGAVLMLLHPVDETNPITVILFGGSELTPQDQTRNVYALRVDDNSQLCEQTPPGMVVRTESGERGSLTVKGVEIELASAAYITTPSDDSMVIVNVEGEVAVTGGGERQLLPVGFQTQVVQLAAGQPVFLGPPSPSAFFNSPVAQWLITSDEGLRQVSDPNTEPNPAIPACGGTIAFGETITAQNVTPGHECLYTFCVGTGEVATIHLDAVDATLNPWIDLRYPDGSLLRFNNDIDEGNLDSLICNRTLFIPGCYTIVARPNKNDSAGAFSLALDRQTACTDPEPRCEVITPFGLNLRTGPGLNYARIQGIPQDTPLQPQDSSPDNQWVRVQVLDTELEGWVNTDVQYLACEQPIGAPPPAPEPVVTAEPPPPPPPAPDDEEDDSPEPPSKLSPFPEL